MASTDGEQTIQTIDSRNDHTIQLSNQGLSDHTHFIRAPLLPTYTEAVTSGSAIGNRKELTKKQRCLLFFLIAFAFLTFAGVAIFFAIKGIIIFRYRLLGESCYGFYTSDKWNDNIGLSKEIYYPGSIWPTKLDAYCDGSDEGAWIVIQYRPTAGLWYSSFSKGWYRYEEGFGDDTGYWIGLKKLHDLTSAAEYELRIDMEGCESTTTTYAQYSNFKVEGPEENYRLTVSGYKGTATDSLSSSSGKSFQTSENIFRCSLSGGWWFSDNDYCCHEANLNGEYYYSSVCQDYACYDCAYDDVCKYRSFWKGFDGRLKTVKVTKMRIRPKFL